LVLFNFNDHASLEILPPMLLELLSFWPINICLLCVFQVIWLMPLVVLEDIFDHGNYYDCSKGKQLSWPSIGNGYDRNHLQYGDYYEVDVRHLWELLHQIFGQECQNCVFRCAYSIISKDCSWVILVVPLNDNSSDILLNQALNVSLLYICWQIHIFLLSLVLNFQEEHLLYPLLHHLPHHHFHS
jgi:hypothetical protein